MKKLFLFFCILLLQEANWAQSSPRVKIPIEASRWYQLNYTTGSLANLFDGNKDTKAYSNWTNMLSNYDAYYPLKDGESMTIDSVRIYDKENVYVNTPLTLYAITDTWERKLIATFTGETYNEWVGPYPSRRYTFKLDTPITNIRYLMLNLYLHAFPGEIELYGSHTPGTVSGATPNPPRSPLKNMFGINGFAWDFMDPYYPKNIEERKMKAVKSFRGFRQYVDWERMEAVEGRYTFSPIDGGGWHLDTIYQRCKEEGIDVLPCIQTIPPWMVNTYPEGQRQRDNNPVRYGKSLSDPASYIEQAKLGFQFAARFGYNKNIDSSLVSVYGVPQWYMQPVNVKKIGLGVIKYIECGNEQDKWWRGRQGYLTGREYAANLSAFYDGHKNTMGQGVGVKNADPSMKVVVTGVAAATPDYFRGIVDWCKEFRGYKPDGTIDLCFDVINYHLYSNDASSSQSGSSSRGMAPELSNCGAVAKSFIQASHLYAYNLPVWITEQGYDIHQGSPLKAIPVGTRTALETQADWTLRSALLYAREGLEKSFFYQMYDGNINYGGKFSSMGLINKPDTARKPAADFLFQANKLFGEYTYQETLHSDPFVDRYALNGQSMYALVVPDEKGRTAAYELNLAGADSAIIYTPVTGSDDMAAQKVSASNGRITITVTETPKFIVPFYFGNQQQIVVDSGQQVTIRANERNRMANSAEVYHAPPSNKNEFLLNEDVLIYPNPATDNLFIQNNKGRRLQIILSGAAGNKISETHVNSSSSVNVGKLAPSYYVLSITDMETKTTVSKLIVKR